MKNFLYVTLLLLGTSAAEAYDVVLESELPPGPSLRVSIKNDAGEDVLTKTVELSSGQKLIEHMNPETYVSRPKFSATLLSDTGETLATTEAPESFQGPINGLIIRVDKEGKINFLNLEEIKEKFWR